MNSLNMAQTKDLLLYIADKIIENADFLTELDARIGDADHGIGMSVGFNKAKEQLNANEFESVNQLWFTTGMAMLNSMGGASGVIFGTMFIGGTKDMPSTQTLDLAFLNEAVDSALVAIKKRGKAEPGDKTLIDALQPASESLKTSFESGASLLDSAKLAENAAYLGYLDSKEYVAKVGRAKVLMERAIGHCDPGAASVWVIFKSLREWLESNS